MKFSEMPYERPDIEALKKFLDDAAARLAAAGTFEEADEVFLEVERGMSHAETMLTIANIRHDINTADEFYDKEVEFADQALPELQEYSQKWDLALLKSPFRADFERKYNRIMFLNTEISLRTFSPEIVPELQRENALTTEYSKLIASAQIPFEGQVYTVSQLTPLKQDPDDARRAAAWKAEGEWYMQNAEKLDSIYDELVRLRDTMGKKLGHKNYIPLGYDRMGRNCYGQEDVERFRAAVVKHIVPLADQVYRRQAERLGKAYPMGYADNALEFRSGNARPCGGPEDILAAGRKFYHELSPETAEFIDVMYDNELLDVLSRKGKAGGGYCTSLGEYHVPFIFANFNGTSGDVEVVTHEPATPSPTTWGATSSPPPASGRAWRAARYTPCPWSSSPGPGPRASSAATRASSATPIWPARSPSSPTAPWWTTSSTSPMSTRSSPPPSATPSGRASPPSTCPG